MNAKAEREMLLIKTDGSKHRISFLGDEPPLPLLQLLVEGYIELVPHSFKLDGAAAMMYVNEDGLSRRLPSNAAATRLCGGLHAIVGNAVLVPRRSAH